LSSVVKSRHLTGFEDNCQCAETGREAHRTAKKPPDDGVMPEHLSINKKPVNKV
jgi:hypothetical protein